MDPEEDPIDISVVIPLLDEEDNIQPLVLALESALDNYGRTYEVVFVDDGSTDGTFKELKAAHEKNPNIKIVKFRKNFGQSASMKAGFDHAKGNIVISMDGDLQNDPTDIPRLVEMLETEDCDVVCGWRADRKDPLSKTITSKFANLLRRSITSEFIHDSGCTLRAYRNECVKDLELYGETHRYIPAMLLWKGYLICETKVQHHQRAYGVTKYNWKRVIKGFLDLIVISFWQKYSVRPIHMFGGAGLISCFAGVLIGGWLGIQKLFFGMALSDRPLLLLAILLIMVGVQLIVSGILADIMLKIYYGGEGRKNYLVERLVD
ncbi:glycosyl transferase family 2 [Methanococcoides methylutens]|uniref:Glycosyl transferase family 2 n=1 Tax=Methanococcoides methylutens TaxID=2226 RepID=A0A099T0B6_METMT|nr:glycosyltransferase family 2 protein [Methanococcoides methylutens]KGK98399.1 glycosyl transferase family 2 [Methanococcoides methylutens]